MVLANAYGDEVWDLTQKDKKKYIQNMKGSLICFCFLYDGVVPASTEQLENLKLYKDEPFVTNGCTRISEFTTDTTLNGLYITVVILILNAILQTIITSFVSNIGYDSYTIES